MSLQSKDISAISNLLDAAFKVQNERLDERFDSIDEKFVEIDQKLIEIDQRFEGLDQKFIGINQRLDGIDYRLGNIESMVLENRNHIDSLATIVGISLQRNDELISNNTREIELMKEKINS